MGLLNKKNLDKARSLALKNKDKIASGVSKATDTIDKKTGGKHADKLKKLDDAAAKFAGRTPAEEDDEAPAREHVAERADGASAPTDAAS